MFTRFLFRASAVANLRSAGVAASVMALSSAALAQPANNACANAQVVSAGIPAATGTNVGATIDGPVPSCTTSNLGGDVWYRYVTTPNSGAVTIDTCGSDFDTILTVYLGACPVAGGPTLLCDDDGATCGAQPFRQSRVLITTPTPTGGDVLFIRVHGFNGSTGNIVLNIQTCAPFVQSITGGGNFCGQRFQQVTVTAGGTGANTHYQWYQDTINFPIPIPDTDGPTQFFPVSPPFNHQYFCVVTNACGSVQSPSITITSDSTPTNVIGPSPTTICEGDSGSISASATALNLNYRWETEAGIGISDGPLFNGTIVSGTQTPTLTFSNPQFADSQGFRCRIFNDCGSVTTPSAQVQLTGPRQLVPSIYPTIQAAIDAIPDGSCGTVSVEPGTHFEHLNFGNRRIRLESNGGPLGNQGPEDNIIDGGGLPPSVITVGGGTRGRCVIKGFTIRNGRSNLGAGISAGFADGVPGPTSVSDCIFEDNAATGQGGAIYSEGNGGLDVQRVIFRRNRATNLGGAISQTGGPLFADRCRFDDNSTLAANGSVGGAVLVALSSAQSRLFNCLYTNNSSRFGGAVASQSSPLLIGTSTFVNNAAASGAAISIANFNGATAAITVANSVIWTNTGGVHTFSQDATVTFTHCDMQSPLIAGPGNISADPRFISASNFRLAPGSPCIDAGIGPTNTNLDLDGNPRRFDDPAAPNTGSGPVPMPDMGAYERNPAPSNPCPPAPQLADGTFTFSTAGATTDGPLEPFLCDNAGDNTIASDVWIRYVPSCTGTASFSLCGSNFDTKIGVYRTDGCPSQPGTIAACNDDSSCGLQSQVSLSVTSGEPLLVRIGGYLGAVGDATLTIGCALSCATDFNQDGERNADDLGDFITCYFSTPPCSGADFNRDNEVNADDLGDFITAYFQGC